MPVGSNRKGRRQQMSEHEVISKLVSSLMITRGGPRNFSMGGGFLRRKAVASRCQHTVRRPVSAKIRGHPPVSAKIGGVPPSKSTPDNFMVRGILYETEGQERTLFHGKAILAPSLKTWNWKLTLYSFNEYKTYKKQSIRSNFSLQWVNWFSICKVKKNGRKNCVKM